MSLQNLLSAQPGDYIRDIEANVSDCKAVQTKAGKTFFKAKLTDGQNTAHAMSFSQTFEHVNGKRVKFSGQSIKRGDDYNGVPQVTIGDKAVWKPVGEATATSPSPAPQIAQNPVAQGSNRPSGGHIEGVTAGQALNKAVDMYLRHHTSINVDGPIELEEAGTWIHKAASMLIRLSQALQEGKLAAPVHQPQAAAPETSGDPF